jgi:hypothetical protein
MPRRLEEKSETASDFPKRFAIGKWQPWIFQGTTGNKERNRGGHRGKNN